MTRVNATEFGTEFRVGRTLLMDDSNRVDSTDDANSDAATDLGADEQQTDRGSDQPNGCPSCGGEADKTVTDSPSFSIVSPPKCEDDGAEYTPPIPRSVAIATVVIGAVCVVAGPIIGFIMHKQLADEFGGGGPGMMCANACFVIASAGIACIWDGLKALRDTLAAEILTPTSSMRVFEVEDAEFRGTFYALSSLRFDANRDEYGARDVDCAAPQSLRHLNLHLDDIRSLASTTFREFDEIRNWTPISTDAPLIKNYVAFGPNEHVALVVETADDDLVESMHFHMWYVEDEEATLPQIVDLFLRIAEQWELLLETLTTQQIITQDKSMMTAHVSKLVAGG
jgi:hypothetical protein